MAVTFRRGVQTIIMTATADEVDEILHIDSIDFQTSAVPGTMSISEKSSGAVIASFASTAAVIFQHMPINRKVNGIVLTIVTTSGSVTIRMKKAV